MHQTKEVMLYSRLVGHRLKFSSWWNHFKLNSSNPLVRSKGVDSLSSSTDSRDTERILASVHDKSAQVRCVALRALEKKANHPKALQSLVKALSDTSAEVREVAVRGPARSGGSGGARAPGAGVSGAGTALPPAPAGAPVRIEARADPPP